MRFTAYAFSAFVLLIGAMSAHSADGPNPAFSRDHATAIIGNWRKIVSPRGNDDHSCKSVHRASLPII